ncbi:hypothetical protein [Rhodoferax sp.]|uniref:hypothetical protein n=1 Tax=Rhodoferax sp. TaxID=50421 RepID=UPI002764A30C|nr:hypothetical protein [Rhodoferax sp.]
MESQTLILIVSVAVVLGLAWFVYQEQQARLLRTRVVDLPGCLRFEAHGFYAEMVQSAKQLKVHAEQAQFVQTPLAGGPKQAQLGPLDATLPAAGLQIEVVKAPGQTASPSAGLCTIVFTASDALTNAANRVSGGQASVLTLDLVPEPVAMSFQNFANRVQLWADKITHRLEQDRLEQQLKEEEAARAALERQRLAEADGKTPDDTEGHQIDFTAQIAKWRKVAGFSGAFSDVSTDAQGRVVWFIDFGNDGRITLHADKRTVHSTLRGASIVSIGAELEIGVRDEYWTEDDPTLTKFRVLQGLPPDERRAWKDRLEKTRDALDSKVDRGY